MGWGKSDVPHDGMAAGSLLLELTLRGPLTLNQAIIGRSSAAVSLRLSAPCTRRGVKRTFSPPAEHYIQQTPRFMLQKRRTVLSHLKVG